MFEQISAIPLFKDMEPKDVTEILKHTTHRVKSYKRNEVVSLAGDTILHQLILITGSVKAEMYDFAGKTIKIEDIEGPRLLAPAFLFGPQNSYPVNIITNEASKILSISKTAFLCLLQENQKILENYLHIISGRAQFLSSKIKFFSFQTIRGKMAMYLLEHIRKTGSNEILLPISQEKLSELFGVARPSLTRAIREMDRDQLITARGKRIRILDPEKLSGLLK